MNKIDIDKAIQSKMFPGRNIRVSPRGSGKRFTRYNLAELLNDLSFDVGAEIGVRRGKFSNHLMKCNPRLTLYCIDPWEAYSNKYNIERQARIYQDAIDNLKGTKAIVIRKRSMDALTDIADRSLDFVFIDGNHDFDFVVMDVIHWSKKVRKNGIIMCHDYYPFSDCGVMNAVDSYTRSHNIDPWYVTKELEPTAYWVNA